MVESVEDGAGDVGAADVEHGLQSVDVDGVDGEDGKMLLVAVDGNVCLDG